MNLRQAFERWGSERLKLIRVKCDGLIREALVYIPTNLCLIKDEPLFIHVFDSTSFHSSQPKLGMFYPNGLIELCEELGAYCVCLLPLGWGPMGLIKGYHAHHTPLTHKRLPDDVQALAELIQKLERLYGAGRHGLIGFADGGVFAHIAVSSFQLRHTVDFIVTVNSTIWHKDEEFDLSSAPEEQSALFICGGEANRRIPIEGSRGKGFLSWLGETLVAKMPRVCGPLLQLKRYREVNPDLPVDREIEPNPVEGVRIEAYRGLRHGREVCLVQVVDDNCPHMWPDRIQDQPGSESPFSAGNRRDTKGQQRTPKIKANALIRGFVKTLQQAWEAGH